MLVEIERVPGVQNLAFQNHRATGPEETLQFLSGEQAAQVNRGACRVDDTGIGPKSRYCERGARSRLDGALVLKRDDGNLAAVDGFNPAFIQHRTGSFDR